MRSGIREAILLGCALLGLARVASAEPAGDAVVWYRASEQCPAGAEFLGRLSGSAQHVRLAGAGDHIDFVVTLLADQGNTVGRLERQTRSGTVAIRELRDSSCARVADALALSLGLALEPSSAPEEKPEPERAAAEKSDSRDGSTSAPVPVGAAPVPSPAPATPHAELAQEKAATDVPARPSANWALGLDAGARLGATPSPMPEALAFVELDPAASDFALRLGGLVARGSTATSIGTVEQWIFAGRFELCPWRFGNRSVSLGPCAAFELGATRAAAQTHESSLWAAPGIAVRTSFVLSRAVALELGVDALAQLDRSEVDAAQNRLYQAEIVAVSGVAGISFRPF